MVPTSAFPPVMPLTDQTIPELLPVTVEVNCTVWPEPANADCGEIETVTSCWPHPQTRPREQRAGMIGNNVRLISYFAELSQNSHFDLVGSGTDCHQEWTLVFIVSLQRHHSPLSLRTCPSALSMVILRSCFVQVLATTGAKMNEKCTCSGRIVSRKGNHHCSVKWHGRKVNELKPASASFKASAGQNTHSSCYPTPSLNWRR